jgi:hypothetical protein
MGGKWKDPNWVFDARDESRVREFCKDLFGTDGTPCELVTLRVILSSRSVDRAGKNTEIYIAGRRVAWVFTKDDQRARIGDGVVVVSGRIFGDGSSRNPDVSWSEGAVVEVRDVPAEIAAKVRERAPELIDLLGSPISPPPDEVAVSPQVQILLDERSSLLARLQTLDAALRAAMPAKRPIPVYEVAHELRDHD